MKRFINFLCLAAFATSIFVGCSKNDSPENLPETSVKKVSFNAKAADTKTYFGDKTDAGYPTVWSENQSVSISLNFGSAQEATVVPSSTGKTASFNAEITQAGDAPYVFYALSPAASVISWSSQFSSVTVDFPATQTPMKGSVDEKAHIMAAKSASFDNFPSEDTPVSLAFSHLAAYGKFQLRNFPETVTINSIELTAQEQVAGRFFFNPGDGSLSVNSAGNSVTLDVSNLEIDKNNTTDFWFSFKPVNLEGKTLKFSVHAENGDVYERTITFPTGKGNFQAGRVASFTISMDGIEPGENKVYKLLTNKNQLLPGAKAIIVAQNYGIAMSTTQNQYNRGNTTVEKSSDRQTITNPGEAVQVFELEAGVGTTDKTVAFKCVNGDQNGKYIGSASSDYNNLLSFDEMAANTCFSVTILNGYTVLAANGTFSRNLIRYNVNNNPPIFSCYGSTSSVIEEVAVYVLEGSGEGSSLIDDPKCPKPVIECSNNTVTITCSADGARIGYTTDGSVPGIDDEGQPTGTTQEYTEPFEITETITVKAFAGAPGYEMSEIAEKECVYSSAIDYVTLDWTVPEEGGSLTSSLLSSIPGVTTSGLGTDYAAGNAPYQVRLDNSGDYIQVKTDDAIGYVSVNYKMIGGNSTSSLKIQESTDGTNWSNVETLTISGAQNSIGTLETSNTFASSSRFVKMIFTKGANVGIGGITISKTAPTPTPSYSITINTPSNGTVTSSAETAKAGTEITLTATPSSGYIFSEWDVKDANENSITVTDNKFIMPSSNVTVSATFVQALTGSYSLTFTTATQPNNNTYTGSYTATVDDKTWTIAGFNNNNNGWSGTIKCGRKNYTSTASIATDWAIPEAIKTISITYGAVTADKVNSVKLYIASNSDFTENLTEHSLEIEANTTKVFTISSPANNRYYKIVYDLASWTSNGFVALSKVVYSK